MNDTIRSIVAMLDAEQKELRVAAAQVLGELGVKDAAVVKALAANIGQDKFLDRYLVQALADIGGASAIRALVAQLDEAGPTADLAAHLLAQLGQPATKALQEAFDSIGEDPVAVDHKRRILCILRQSPSKETVKVLESALADPELAEAAAEGLRGCLDHLTEKSTKALAERLTKTALDESMDPPAAAQAVQLLAELDREGHRNEFVKCAAPGRAPMVRRAALDALHGVKLTPTQLQTLLENLLEEDATHVVEATTRLLGDVEVFPDKCHGTLIELLDRGIPAVEEMAVRALGRVESTEVARKLLPLLHSERPGLRNAAAVALGTNPSAIEPLVKALRTEKERARAERIAGPISAHAESLDDKTLAGLVDRGQKLLLNQDAVGDVILLTLLRARGPEVAELIVDKAVRLRRAKKFEDATMLLMFAAQTGSLTAEGRYQLALVRLLIDAGRERPAPSKGYVPSETGNATMGYLAVLVREGFPVYDRIVKESMLTPEILLRVAEHFSDGVGNDRRFGAELAQFLVQKHEKKKVGEEARSLLRGASL